MRSSGKTGSSRQKEAEHANRKIGSEYKKDLLEKLLKRSPTSYGSYEQSVREILDDVRDRRDQALFEYTEKFDGARISADNILVTEEEIREAYREVDPELVEIIRRSLHNIRTYHEKQRQYSWFDSRPDGTILGQKVTPLARIGVYVPGGKAAYPSSVLMNIAPAKVAGVDEIIMTTPPGKDGKSHGDHTGGCQRSRRGAAFIKPVGPRPSRPLPSAPRASKVDKIVGPGNIYVALAKNPYTDT